MDVHTTELFYITEVFSSARASFGTSPILWIEFLCWRETAFWQAVLRLWGRPCVSAP